MRISVAIMIVYGLYLLYQYETLIEDVSNVSSQTFEDVLEWGKNKLENIKVENLNERAIPDLSSLEKELNDTESETINKDL